MSTCASISNIPEIIYMAGSATVFGNNCFSNFLNWTGRYSKHFPEGATISNPYNSVKSSTRRQVKLNLQPSNHQLTPITHQIQYSYLLYICYIFRGGLYNRFNYR